MDFYTMSDLGIERELGARLRGLRLRRNLTQQQLAQAAGVSLNTVKSLEHGRGKIASVIAVLRQLQMLQSLDGFIPMPPPVSPLQLARMQGRRRQRATGSRQVKKPLS